MVPVLRKPKHAAAAFSVKGQGTWRKLCNLALESLHVIHVTTQGVVIARMKLYEVWEADPMFDVSSRIVLRKSSVRP